MTGLLLLQPPAKDHLTGFPERHYQKMALTTAAARAPQHEQGCRLRHVFQRVDAAILSDEQGNDLTRTRANVTALS
jgi:hypothetical protein